MIYILQLLIGESLPTPLGTPRTKHHAIAYVSPLLRDLYLAMKSGRRFGMYGRSVKIPTIRETLSFPSLRAMIQFFNNGPGQLPSALAQITHVYIVYRDDTDILPVFNTFNYAYEAFELLNTKLPHMALHRIHLDLNEVETKNYGVNVDSPGIWNLLRVRGLKQLIVTPAGRTCKMIPGHRALLAKRVCSSPNMPWKPLGIEQPEQDNRLTHASLGKKETWLEEQYRFLHDSRLPRNWNRRYFATSKEIKAFEIGVDDFCWAWHSSGRILVPVDLY